MKRLLSIDLEKDQRLFHRDYADESYQSVTLAPGLNTLSGTFRHLHSCVHTDK